MGQEKGFEVLHPFSVEQSVYLDGTDPSKADGPPGKHTSHKSQALLAAKCGHAAPRGGPDDFVKILKLILDPAMQPVLVQCQGGRHRTGMSMLCLLYTSDAADEEDSVDFGCCRIIKKKNSGDK
eukprot:TRINITY_DN14423_c0_g2_i1.p1 TRINITY_DN14423_c0_g2~~TRINITY_DN14423_c0_g2_i1.p1  ORF type:complete len:124 (+),score=23.51 TRINITY_DN14423_c0_g2_i1:186-557(+)